MTTIDLSDHRRLLPIAVAIVAAVGLTLFLYSRWLPPQIGVDEGVFMTVDALFTAVTSRDKQRLDDCERRLRTFREAGTLPHASARYLDSIIEQARSGQWESSARKLYDFMRGQRRV